MPLTPVEQEPAKEAMYGKKVAVVGSKSSDDVWEVRLKPDGTLGCQCISYRFSAKGQPASMKHCKHTDAYRNGEQQSPVPAFQKTSTPLVPMAQTPKAIRDEAVKAAQSILGGWVPAASVKKEVAKAASRIEEAIRKFMSQLPSQMPVAAGVGPVDAFDTGVRFITLDD